MRFQDKVIIVTGGARGIGKGIVTAFIQEGGQVVIADVLENEAAQTVSEMKSKGGKALFLKTDVTKTGEVQATIKTCLDRFAKIDILVNNVGWDKLGLFKDTNEEFWDKIIEINYKGVLRFCKAVLDPMITRKYGKIVNIGSDAGRVGSTGEAVYSGCKGGVIAFTKTLARETARYGINVNCVCPGPTNTPLLDEQSKFEFGAKIMAGMEKFIPLGRIGAPSDIAAAVLFFSSDNANFITGQTLSVSGGLNMI